MKIFLRYLLLPFITACIVTTSVVIFYYLDVSKSTGSDKAESFPKNPASVSQAYTVKKAVHSPSVPYGDFVYPAGDTRDPFQKVSVPMDVEQPSENMPPSVTLTGVIWDDEDPVAIITDLDNNSYLVRTGEEINRGKILAIQPRGITVEIDGRIQELILWSPDM